MFETFGFETLTAPQAAVWFALAIGVVFAFFRFVQEMSATYKHKVTSLSESDYAGTGAERKELNKLPVSVLQPQGPLFFGSIEPLMEAYANAPKHDKLIVDMSKVTMADLSGVYALEDLIMEAKSKNVEVFVSNASPKIKETLEKVEFIKHIGADHYMDSMRTVIPILLEMYHVDLKHKDVVDAKQVPVLEKFQSAINTHNLDALMGLYAEEATLVPAYSSNFKKGKKAIRHFYEDFFEKDDVQITVYQVNSQKADGLKVDNGMYVMKWKNHLPTAKKERETLSTESSRYRQTPQGTVDTLTHNMTASLVILSPYSKFGDL